MIVLYRNWCETPLLRWVLIFRLRIECVIKSEYRLAWSCPKEWESYDGLIHNEFKLRVLLNNHTGELFDLLLYSLFSKDKVWRLFLLSWGLTILNLVIKKSSLKTLFFRSLEEWAGTMGYFCIIFQKPKSSFNERFSVLYVDVKVAFAGYIFWEANWLKATFIRKWQFVLSDNRSIAPRTISILQLLRCNGA